MILTIKKIRKTRRCASCKKISITHSPTDNFKSRDASASNKSRDASASKKPKTDTLDALGDAITTILTTNLDNNFDNQS